jgi:hypothetical protein
MNISHVIPLEEFQTAMLELANYLTSIPDRLRLIRTKAMFLRVEARTTSARYPPERPWICFADFTMSGTRGAARGYRSYELWMDLPRRENALEGNGWEDTLMFTFRDSGNSG